MSRPYLIRDAQIADVYAIARTLRDGDRAECLAYGRTPALGMRRVYYNSWYRRTAVIGDDLAAIWGAGNAGRGGLLGHTASVWLMTAKVIEELPVSFVRESRREIRTMLDTHDRLEGECAVEYLAAQKFLALLGFEFDPTIEINGKRFRPFHLERKCPST